MCILSILCSSAVNHNDLLFFILCFVNYCLFGKADGTELSFWVQFNVHNKVMDARQLSANPGF